MKEEHYDELMQEQRIEEAGGYDEIEPSSVEEYYQDNKEDIIAQFRKDMDDEHLTEDDETLEGWYKPLLLEIAKDWQDSE